MALGLFDETLRVEGWFDESALIAGWFDESLIQQEGPVGEEPATLGLMPYYRRRSRRA